MRSLILKMACISMTLAGCSTVVTDGYPGHLPAPDTRAIVWGNDPTAVDVAATWLQKRGLSVIERSMIGAEVEAEAEEMVRTIDLGHTLKDEAIVLRAAKKMNVQEVVFVDRGGDDRAPLVAVRGLAVDSGVVRWSGNARHKSFKDRPARHTIANLTCEALATAWEFRPPGNKWFISSESMCVAKPSMNK